MASLPDLRLHERALLLGLDDDRGTFHYAGTYAYAVAGGIIAELLLEGRIGLEERGGRKKPLVTVLRSTQVGDPVIDDALQRIRTAKRRADLSRWVSRLAGQAKLKHDVARRLVRKGVVRETEDRVLLVFRRTIYPELDPGPERELIESLRHAILSDDPVTDPRTAILAVLAWKTGILRPVLDRKEEKARRKRLESLAEGEAVSAAAAGAIEAAHAAIMAATIAASAATSAAAAST